MKNSLAFYICPRVAIVEQIDKNSRKESMMENRLLLDNSEILN